LHYNFYYKKMHLLSAVILKPQSDLVHTFIASLQAKQFPVTRIQSFLCPIQSASNTAIVSFLAQRIFAVVTLDWTAFSDHSFFIVWGFEVVIGSILRVIGVVALWKRFLVFSFD
jgi:hypothetical protein